MSSEAWDLLAVKETPQRLPPSLGSSHASSLHRRVYPVKKALNDKLIYKKGIPGRLTVYTLRPIDRKLNQTP